MTAVLPFGLLHRETAPQGSTYEIPEMTYNPQRQISVPTNSLSEHGWEDYKDGSLIVSAGTQSLIYTSGQYAEDTDWNTDD